MFSVNTFSQNCDFELKSALNESLKEIAIYIESNKGGKISNGKYAVYAINFYSKDNFKKEFCLTMGSFCNTYELPSVKKKYVYYYENEIILIYLSEKYSEYNCFFDNYFKRIDESDLQNINNKLIPIREGQILSHEKYLKLCIVNNRIFKSLLDDSEFSSDEYIFESLDYKIEPIFNRDSL